MKKLDIKRLLSLPQAQAILASDPQVRQVLQQLLLELAHSERDLALVNWDRRKGPIASYHSDVASRARITARALTKGPRAARARDLTGEANEPHAA
jgi:hypothetical protein